MSKKPLLSEGTARRWAKYAGIQNESKALLSEMYKNEAVYNEEALEEEALEEEALEEEALEEAAIIAELEEMLAEQDDELEDDELEDEEEDPMGSSMYQAASERKLMYSPESSTTSV